MKIVYGFLLVLVSVMAIFAIAIDKNENELRDGVDGNTKAIDDILVAMLNRED